MLDLLADQEEALQLLTVVDNSPVCENEESVHSYASPGRRARYLPANENLGPAGGIALGMGAALEEAEDRDWVVLLDDDDPPPAPDTLAKLKRFADGMLAQDPQVAAVGLTGARFDSKRGRLIRVPDEELGGAVSVDYIGGGQLPMYRAGAIRSAGPFQHSLFWGYEELEYGLRLKREGYNLYAHGELWREQRERRNRLGLEVKPRVRLAEATWRRYYGLRNLIYLLRASGQRTTALRVTLVTGIGKPLVNLAIDPRAAVAHLGLNWRACRDAWTGRLGRTLTPESNPPKAA